jgi:hypothetical protein
LGRQTIIIWGNPEIAGQPMESSSLWVVSPGGHVLCKRFSFAQSNQKRDDREGMKMDQTITQADLTALAAKLDELADVLSPKERSLLLAVFALAGQTISARVHAGSSPGGSQTESAGAPVAAQIALSAGFKDAFQAVGLADINLRSGVDLAAGGVGIGVVY